MVKLFNEHWLWTVVSYCYYNNHYYDIMNIAFLPEISPPTTSLAAVSRIITSVLLDTFVVRTVLVPALMRQSERSGGGSSISMRYPWYTLW